MGLAPTLEDRMGGNQAALIEDANDVGQLVYLHDPTGAIGNAVVVADTTRCVVPCTRTLATVASQSSRRNAPTEAMYLEMLPDPPPINHNPHRIVTFSRMRYGTDRRVVEDKITRFLARPSR
jgi:hypothetical protein